MTDLHAISTRNRRRSPPPLRFRTATNTVPGR